MLSEVTSDLFDIVGRLKAVNSGYRVFWNGMRERFEVHTTGLEFIVPFEILDERTVLHAMKTRRENQDAIELEVETNNAKIESSAQRELDSEMRRLGDMFRYAGSRTGHEVNFGKERRIWI